MKDIGDWLQETYLKFAEQENTNPRRSASKFLQRYVFCDAYEIFFGSIHIELHQWLSRLAEQRMNFHEGLFPALTPTRITILKKMNNKISLVPFATLQRTTLLVEGIFTYNHRLVILNLTV